MIQIRPVSDLRNKFPEIETLVNSGNPVYLTKNGYGANSLGGGFCICDKCYLKSVFCLDLSKYNQEVNNYCYTTY